MKTLRIFISSPGDVAEEREKAKQVISSLQREVGGDVVLVPVLWEDLAIPATASFQEGIDFVLSEKHRIDIAVFVLWSRLGSPLGACITKPDGSAYRSGTEREFDLMLSAFEQSGRKMPIILAYTRDDLGAFSEKLDARTQQEDALEELLRQRKLVKQFIQERFHDEQGRNLRAYHTYREPVGFAQRLHVHLREAIHDLLGRNYAGTRWEDSPYRSLDFFDVKHAPIFFGRDEETCDVLQRLRDQQSAGCAFVCIVGASGSGKSSLARAGVAGTLIQRSFEDGVREWRAAALIPGLKQGDLYRGLTRCLAEMLPELRTGVGGLEKLYDCFREQNHAAAGILIATAFAAATAKAGGALRVLVVLDQMEELWTDGSISPEQREGFLEALESLAGAEGISVLATLRSDFYPQAQLSGAFLRMKGERGHFDLTPPGPAALHQLIVQPAHCAGLVFEREEPSGRTLDQQILADATRDPSALPLLQYALAELHELRDEPKRQLTFAAYKDMGGVEGALGKRAAQTFDSLPTDVQAALYELLPLLVSVDVAGDQNAVRRRAPLEELLATPARRSLTEALIEARFLTTDSEGEEKKPVVGLAHEALLRRWVKLKEWTDRNSDLLRLRGTVEQAETRWNQSKGHRSLLLSPGLPLEEGRRLLRDGAHLLKTGTRDYVEISIAQFEADEVRRKADEERRLKMRRAAVVALSVLTLLALGAAVWALGQQDAAEQASKKAEEEKIRAEGALRETERQLERSELEEGRAWFERAKLAWESEKDPLTALMLAGRAMGFHGFGRRAVESTEFETQFRSLLGKSMDDPMNESARLAEKAAIEMFVTDLPASALPIWSSPTRAHHFDTVASVAFSPDGTRLASGSRDNTVKLWDVASGQEVASLARHSDGVLSVAFSLDGTRLASGSMDNTVKLWDVASGQEAATLQGHGGDVNSVAFSPDGSRLASGSGDNTVKLWDVASGAEVASLAGHSGAVTSVAFSPDGSRLVVGLNDGTVKLWDVASRKEGELATLQGHSGWVNSVAFSPDSTWLASGSEDSTVKLWDGSTGKEVASLEGHSVAVSSVAFSPDGSLLASGSGALRDLTAMAW